MSLETTPLPLERLHREAALGRLTAGLWHETMNLLSILSVWTKLLGPDAASETLPEVATQARPKIEAALSRLTRLSTAQQVCAAGALKDAALTCTLGDLLIWLEALVEPRLRAAGVIFTVEAGSAPEARETAVPGKAGEVLLALALLVQRLADSGSPTVSLMLHPGGASPTLGIKADTANGLKALQKSGDSELLLCARLVAASGGRLDLGETVVVSFATSSASAL